ncbi:E3 ubiquitin-protein ligase MBR1 isoform X2 [Raphanus sativus]|uniref:RING-type E3 ubiquitin transferase n=1 Tax=Raphanus sativus TaxID=3726 RepID=A0A9W3CDB4_RAPSA|nr:E3 ubiquitin-protein ligase MBR1 isoform X2 [Raphanus sativus]
MPISSEPSSTTIGHHIRLRPRNPPPFATAEEPLVPKPSRICKSAMSSFFLLPSSSSSSSSSNETTKKTTSPFRGLGCTSSASQQVSAPAVIRSSADWNPRKTKSKNKNRGTSRYSGGSVKILTEVGDGGNACGASPDVWCGPGVGFSTDAVVGGSINPVEANPPRRNIPARRKIDGDKNYSSTSHNSNQTEGSSVPPRRSHNQEANPYFDSDLTSRGEQTQTLFSDRYHRHIRQPYPNGLSEMVLLQNGLVMGGTLSSYDHFRDLRLNVDGMSYEIKTCLWKVKPFNKATPLEDKKCSICQEEYEAKDEVGKLPCGHRYHIICVKQWLLRKNSCPVCKTMPCFSKS